MVVIQLFMQLCWLIVCYCHQLSKRLKEVEKDRNMWWTCCEKANQSLLKTAEEVGQYIAVGVYAMNMQ